VRRTVGGPVDGICVQWNDEEGWGSVSAPGLEGEVWILFPMLVMDGYGSLTPGQRVRFTYETPGQDGFPHRGIEVWPTAGEA
jgi:cold shock CspA family protein